jgi:hypothetical protein
MLVDCVTVEWERLVVGWGGGDTGGGGGGTNMADRIGVRACAGLAAGHSCLMDALLCVCVRVCVGVSYMEEAWLHLGVCPCVVMVLGTQESIR